MAFANIEDSDQTAQSDQAFMFALEKSVAPDESMKREKTDEILYQCAGWPWLFFV